MTGIPAMLILPSYRTSGRLSGGQNSFLDFNPLAEARKQKPHQICRAVFAAYASTLAITRSFNSLIDHG
jgi:hypothetical protein